MERGGFSGPGVGQMGGQIGRARGSEPAGEGPALSWGRNRVGREHEKVRGGLLERGGRGSKAIFTSFPMLSGTKPTPCLAQEGLRQKGKTKLSTCFPIAASIAKSSPTFPAEALLTGLTCIFIRDLDMEVIKNCK